MTFYPYFTDVQITPFFISSILLVASIYAYHADKKSPALILLFLSTLGFGYFIANLDPFLILWDEQYHALVAKNMITDPLRPVLYPEPLLDFDYRNWTGNYIWLHKQPLFLWQIALSLKLFGTSELAVRIPSIIMHAFTTLMIYRLGKISYSSRVGFYGAVFFSVAWYQLELISGRISTDHNDVAFLFYVTASFWAWFEYQRSGKGYWVIFIGLFSGAAVLVKWLTGLIVYAAWGIAKIGVEGRQSLHFKKWQALISSFAVTLLVFIPWQIYILLRYPEEAIFEYQLNSHHFFHAVEGHSGDDWFHFKAINDIYGSGLLVPILLILGLVFYLRKAVNKTYRIAILTAVIITYAFFTMASTKMTSFTIIVSPFIYLGLAVLFEKVLTWPERSKKLQVFNKIFRPILLITICFFLLNLSKIQNSHTMWKPHDNHNRALELEQIALIKKLPAVLGHDKYVVFNPDLRLNAHIELMFYTNYIAYHFIPDQDQINRIKEQSYKIAIMDRGNLPEFIKEDEQIIKIKISDLREPPHPQ